MREYVFYTGDGFTISPYSDAQIPDCENFQILGFEKGENAQSAFSKLLKSSPWIEEKGFSEVKCSEIIGSAEHFCIR